MAKYADSHVSPQGPGDARPTAIQIINDEGLEGKLQGKTFLITGCSSGIGVETARALKATGATLYLTVRDVAKGESVLSDILEPGRVELLEVDLGSLASVRKGAAEFLERNKGRGLNVLILNAGVMAIPTLTKTVDGFETQFGTNHLGHFLLFSLLKPALVAASTPEFNSRVVVVSSAGHRISEIRFDDYGFEKGDYTPMGAYGQSKTANIYLSNYIDRHFGPEGVHSNAVHPGGIMTPLVKHIPAETLESFSKSEKLQKYFKNTEQGAATTVWAAVGKVFEGNGGKYLENCQVGTPMAENAAIGDGGFTKHAFDEEKEERLWADSLKMVGLN